MHWRKIAELVKLCNTPASIISPVPILAISLFLIAFKNITIYNIQILFIAIFFTIISNCASNLWNHSNDVKEDITQRKKTLLTSDISMQRTGFLIAIFLYAGSTFLVFYLSSLLNRPIFAFFLIWAFATWWYSDTLILKKVTGFRLKEHYIGEAITYSIAWPAYILSIWLIFSEMNVNGLIIAMAFVFLSISGLLLKDMKDISGDRKVGLKTFGVIFLPSQLIRFSCYFMILFYFVILNPFSFMYLGMGLFLLVFPFLYFLKKTFFHMQLKNWKLDISDTKAIKILGYSGYISVISLGLSSFI